MTTIRRHNVTFVGRRDVTDREHVEIVAEQSAAARDHELRRLEDDKASLIASANRRHQEQMDRIERDYRTARDRIFLDHERNQDAAQSFVETRARMRMAARVGLGLPFLDPLNQFGRKDPYAGDHRGVITIGR